jgi:glycerophosphoryl diester phosphodiesterase
MAAKPTGGEKSLQEGEIYRRIGHKGAPAVRAGNTLESFDAAVELGVDMIELDVLRAKEGRLIVAHDFEDAARRRPLDLTEALDAFREPPLDQVEFDCDLKLPGREAELVGALEGRGLLDRAMVSTMELSSLTKLRQLEPDLRLGWTFPKTRRDWTQYKWAGPALAAGLAGLRRRFPKILADRAPELEIDAVWAYHGVVSPNLAKVTRELGLELIAWTVDDAARMAELLAMGVDGLCTNDPRLFEVAERQAAAMETSDERQPEDEKQPQRASAEEEGEGEPKKRHFRRKKKEEEKAASEQPEG